MEPYCILRKKGGKLVDLKRIKTVMILILVAINAFFVYNLVSDHLEKNYINDATVKNAVEILTREGIEIDVSAVPKKKLTLPIYESIFDEEHNEKVVALFSDADIESTFSIPDGMRFVTKNADQIEFSEEFGIVFVSGESDRYTDFSNMIASVPQTDFLPAETDDALIKSVKEMLSADTSASVGYAKLGAQCTGVYDDETTGYRFLRFSQTMDKTPIYGHDIICVADGEKLLYLEGLWSFLSTDAEYSSQLYDQVNILFMEKKSIDAVKAEHEAAGLEVQTEYRIEKIDSVYCTYFNDSKTGIYFIPAWRITYFDGSESVYDALNGIQYVGVE